MKLSVIVLFLTLSSTSIFAQIGRLALSPVQRIEQVIGATDVAIQFSRPSMKGRTIFGDLVPYDKIWRTGANKSTTIEFSKEVTINNKVLPKGKYAIFTIPSQDKWEVIFYPDTDNYGVPEDYSKEKVVANITVPTNKLDKEVEVFSISISDFTNYQFTMDILWSNVSVSVPIELSTKSDMDNKISRILTGPHYQDYYAAAEYQMESGKEYEQGLQWINQAIEMTDTVTWWDLRIKANMLLNLEQKEEGLMVAKEGLKLAKLETYISSRNYGIKQFEVLIEKLESK